jgi:hypothetical protein
MYCLVFPRVWRCLALLALVATAHADTPSPQVEVLSFAKAKQALAIPLQNATAHAVRTPSAATAWGGLRAWPQRVANYEIQAQLDPQTHQIKGVQTLHWRNRSAQAISTVYLHLYLNAFANANSTYMRELAVSELAENEDAEPEPALNDDEWGGILVRSVAQAGVRAAPKQRFVQPDGGPSTDQTVLALDLATAVPPGGGTYAADAFFIPPAARAVKNRVRGQLSHGRAVVSENGGVGATRRT